MSDNGKQIAFTAFILASLNIAFNRDICLAVSDSQVTYALIANVGQCQIANSA